MASNSTTWFHETPENNPYLLQERVNGNLWMARLWSLYFVTEQAEAPFRMVAQYNEAPLTLEWEPGKWLRLRSDQAVPSVATAFSNILQIPASLTYTDIEGKIITEWHSDGGAAQWQKIQGNPSYQNPVRLNA